MQRTHFFFVTPTTSQPRYHKRIMSCREQGHAVTVFSFRRGLFEVNALPPEVETIDLGFLREGRYAARIISLFRAAFMVRAVLRGSGGGCGVLYCFGLDNALVGRLVRPKSMRLVYEVGDIIYLLPGQGALTRAVMTALDRSMVRHVDLLVLTSEGFLSHYWRLGPDCQVSVVENKLSSKLLDAPRSAARRFSRPVRIGFVGLIYYLDCLVPLIDFVVTHEGYEAHFFGDGTDTRGIREAADRHSDRIFFHGPFRNPGDLPGIYRRIDFNYVVYDPDDENVKVLIPNKFYESLYFAIPLIVADGTLLAERVRSLGIGYVIDAHRIAGELERIFSELTEERYGAMGAAAFAVPVEELVDESDRLIAAIARGAVS